MRLADVGLARYRSASINKALKTPSLLSATAGVMVLDFFILSERKSSRSFVSLLRKPPGLNVYCARRKHTNTDCPNERNNGEPPADPAQHSFRHHSLRDAREVSDPLVVPPGHPEANGLGTNGVPDPPVLPHCFVRLF